jgi:dihydrofolate reductase
MKNTDSRFPVVVGLNHHNVPMASAEPKLIYSIGVSLDGYIADPNGEIDWTAPDEQLFLFHLERVRELGAHLCGRRLYEAMLYWETADEQPDVGPAQLEFASVWKALPKVVFSRTLDRVEGNARLATDSLEAEVDRLKREAGGDIEVGGAGLAGSAAQLGLIDDYRLFVYPVVLGGGTPLFPPLDHMIELELVETRSFGGVVYLRYGAV